MSSRISCSLDGSTDLFSLLVRGHFDSSVKQNLLLSSLSQLAAGLALRLEFHWGLHIACLDDGITNPQRFHGIIQIGNL